MQREPAPDRILQLGYAFREAKVLLCAVEFDVFSTLAGKSLTWNELADSISMHPRGARDFFDALVALELLDVDAHGRYRNSEDAALFLDRAKPGYVGDSLVHLDVRM